MALEYDDVLLLDTRGTKALDDLDQHFRAGDGTDGIRHPAPFALFRFAANGINFDADDVAILEKALPGFLRMIGTGQLGMPRHHHGGNGLAGMDFIVNRDRSGVVDFDDPARIRPRHGQRRVLDLLGTTRGQEGAGLASGICCISVSTSMSPGARAVDGALGLVGGGRRGEFNHRGAQPSVQPTPSFGHRFPFADAAQDDPRTACRDGLLERSPPNDEPPKLIFVDTAAEYWRGDGSLAHTHVVDGADVDDAPFVRRYLYAAAQHSAGLAELNDRSLSGARGANPLNMIDYTPLYRCALVNLVRWVCDGVSPPPSAVPRWSDGSAVQPRRRAETAVSDPVARVARPGRAADHVGARPRPRRRPRRRPLPGPSPSASRTPARCPRSTSTATR